MKQTHPDRKRGGLVWRMALLVLAALGLFGLLAACGGDDDTPTPTSPTTTDTGDGDAADGGAVDDTTDAAMTAAEEFFAKDWEFVIPSQRWFSWAPVTMKRLIDDNLPNVTLVIQDATNIETLRDYGARPATKATTVLQEAPKTWDAIRAGLDGVLGEGVPQPDPLPRPMWGIYPYSQMQVLTEATSGINSVLDFDGMVVSLGFDPNQFSSIVYEEWIELSGTKPRVIYTNERGEDGLMNRSFDVASSGIVFQLTTSGNMIPFQTARELRIVDWTTDLIAEQRALHPKWDFMVPVTLCNSAMSSAMNLPYDVIDPNYVGTGSSGGENCNVAPGGHSVMYNVLAEFPDEAVYQMTKVLLENMTELQLLYPGAPWAAEVYAQRFAHTTERQEFFHPGAVRAFEEFGQTYGLEGVEEWTSQRTDPLRWWEDFIE